MHCPHACVHTCMHASVPVNASQGCISAGAVRHTPPGATCWWWPVQVPSLGVVGCSRAWLAWSALMPTGALIICQPWHCAKHNLEHQYEQLRAASAGTSGGSYCSLMNHCMASGAAGATGFAVARPAAVWQGAALLA